MKPTHKAITIRLALLIAVPAVWTLILYLFQRPVDTRAVDGIEILMEEPLGTWQHDAALQAYLPNETAALPTPATGTAVYALRQAYFIHFLHLRALYMALATLAVIAIHSILSRKVRQS